MSLAFPSTDLLILSPASLLREAWRALLAGQPGIEVVGACADAQELFDLIESDPPTTVLLDVPVPEPKLTREIRTVAPEVGLLFLTLSYELRDLLPLLRAGATGFITRDSSVGDLSRAIIAAGRGELVLPPSVAAHALSALATGQLLKTESYEPLSEREAEVLGLLSQGPTNKDIAQTLFLSVRTVEAHLRNIYGKPGVNTRTEAAIWAVRNGYGQEK